MTVVSLPCTATDVMLTTSWSQSPLYYHRWPMRPEASRTIRSA
jgi:hypothetical protein